MIRHSEIPTCDVEDCGDRACCTCGERLMCTGPEPAAITCPTHDGECTVCADESRCPECQVERLKARAEDDDPRRWSA